MVRAVFEMSVAMNLKAPDEQTFRPSIHLWLLSLCYSSNAVIHIVLPFKKTALQMEPSFRVPTYFVQESYGFSATYPDGTVAFYDPEMNFISQEGISRVRYSTPFAKTPTPGLRDSSETPRASPAPSTYSEDHLGPESTSLSIPLHSHTHPYIPPHVHTPTRETTESGYGYDSNQDLSGDGRLGAFYGTQKRISDSQTEDSSNYGSSVLAGPHTSDRYWADDERTPTPEPHGRTRYPTPASVVSKKSFSSDKTYTGLRTVRDENVKINLRKKRLVPEVSIPFNARSAAELKRMRKMNAKQAQKK